MNPESHIKTYAAIESLNQELNDTAAHNKQLARNIIRCLGGELDSIHFRKAIYIIGVLFIAVATWLCFMTTIAFSLLLVTSACVVSVIRAAHEQQAKDLQAQINAATTLLNVQIRELALRNRITTEALKVARATLETDTTLTTPS